MVRLPRMVCCLALLFTAACSDRDSRAELVMINGAEISTIDPSQTSAQTEGRVINALFEGLMRFTPQGTAEPGCAHEPVISPDKKTWTFTIREAARWSDGSPVTAHDFVRSWRRFLEPATAADYADVFSCIKGAREFAAGRSSDFSLVGIRAPDSRTLVLEMVNPVPYFRDLAAFMCLVPIHIPLLERHGKSYWKPGVLVGNGAYVLKEWRLNDRIRLEKNPHYWDAANVKLRTIDVLPIDNPNTALNLFLTGEVDLMMDKGLIPPNLGSALQTKPWFHHKPFLGVWFLRFNVRKPPFDNPMVRKALAMTIDRPRLTREITRLGEPPAQHFTPPGIGDGYSPPAGHAYDPDGARRLLAEAGFPDGRGFPVLNFLYPSKFASDNGIAVELQATWKKELNVTADLQRKEYRIYLDSQRAMDYEVSRSSWVGDYNDPNTFLDVFTSTNGNNRTGWASADYDRLIAAAAAEPDTARRNQLLRDAEAILVERDCVIAPVYHYVGVQFYHPDVLGGIEANLIDEHPLRTVFRR